MRCDDWTGPRLEKGRGEGAFASIDPSARRGHAPELNELSIPLNPQYNPHSADVCVDARMTTHPADPVRILLDIAAAADRLSIGRTLVLRMISTGQLPSVTIGRRRLIDERDLRRFVERQKRSGRPDSQSR